MTLGQPLVISNDNVVLDMPARHESSQLDHGMGSDNCDLSLGMLNSTMYASFPNVHSQSRKLLSLCSELYRILGTIIEQQYGRNLGMNLPSSVVNVVSPISAIDDSLRDWVDAQCSDLRPVSSTDLLSMLSSFNPEDSLASANRSRVVLTLRYLNVRLLLHRPVLVKYFETSLSPTKDPAETTLLSHLGSHSIQICFRSSMEIITIVNTLVHSAKPAKRWLNAWWFTLYYSEYLLILCKGCH